MKKKIISLLLIVTLIFASSIGVFADSVAKETKTKPSKIEIPVVYEIDSNGDKTISSTPISFYMELSKKGKATIDSKNNDKNVDSIVPLPDPGAVKVTSSVYSSFNSSNYATRINYALNVVFISAWSTLGMKLHTAGGRAQIYEDAWKSVWVAAAYSTAYGLVQSKATSIETYSESYQYTVWSDYWQMYIDHNVLIFYSDSSYTNPTEVNDWISTYQSDYAGTF